ncbi:MAG: hypothetical protein U0573_12940 [Phycisphaerales bacterium]|nr:hypothetical protein [Planctomycetota bacterium]
MSETHAPDPRWAGSLQRIEEHSLFLERRQDELLAAIDDLASRQAALAKRLEQLERAVRDVDRRAHSPGGDQPGEGHED